MNSETKPKPKRSAAKIAADNRYMAKLKRKVVNFNPETEADLLEFIKNVNFTHWVKAKIKQDIDLNKK